MKISPEARACLQSMLDSTSDAMDELMLESAYRRGWWDAREETNRMLELLSAPKAVRMARLRVLMTETEGMD